MRIRGHLRHSKRLRGMISATALNEIGRAIYVASDFLRVEAHRSIAAGATQGAGHVPSEPGEPPNWDTGQLATNITNQRTGQLSAEVRSQAPYSLPLEFGTSKMAERPFMRPAAAKTRPQAELLVRRAVNRSIKTS